eukprot:CAMPEP_0184201590 /NCGR_PEP_ID=MMETSP0976-20121227/8116_1 /TAXON_ID=483370 /ORGANISM="non described non described, Strain CCMP2097" /LENGTH=733 /DNA_ID=CAMNT_0026506115 /DNA_START=65 /DNA_END=2263 /DNA_ORIENTATION=+
MLLAPHCSAIVWPVWPSATMLPMMPSMAKRPLAISAWSLTAFFSESNLAAEEPDAVVAVVLGRRPPGHLDQAGEEEDLGNTGSGDLEDARKAVGHVAELELLRQRQVARALRTSSPGRRAGRRPADARAYRAPILLLALARDGSALGFKVKVKVDLFVRNLPFEATVEDVRGAFANVCAVEDVRVPVCGDGRARGFAFVTVAATESDAVQRAMDGSMVVGRKITVGLATSKKSAPGSIELNNDLVAAETAAEILTLVETQGAAFNAVNYATALHRLGVLSRETASSPLLQKLSDGAAASVIKEPSQWASRGLANACWGVAKIGTIEAPLLFDAVAAEASKKIGTFTSQNLANTAWAFATAGVEAPALFEAIAAEAPKKIMSFNSQALANTVWSYATAAVVAPALFEAIADEAPHKIATFNPQNLANTVWAYATAGFEATALFEAVAAEAPKKIATFKSQELANMAWAYSTAGVDAPALFQVLAAKALKKIAMFNAQDLANTVWAYATAGAEAPALFTAVAAEAPKKIATFSSQALANTAWAYATAGVAAPALFEAVAVESSKKIATFTPQDLANTAWAYATAGVAAPALFEALATSIEAKMSEFSPDGLSQLHQVFLHLQLEAPQHALTLLLSRHEAELRAAFLREEPSPSRSQRDVSAALDRIGWAHEFEHVTTEGISLDMARPASKVAVEFDGPTHYLAGASDGSRRVLDGKSKAKERLLRRLGWDLIRVP